MSLFDQLLGTVRGALEGYDLQPSRQDGHEADCLCRRCMFVRGIRGELAAFEKAEKRAKKPKRREAPLDPMVDAVVSGRFPPGKRAKK